jgi:hypothetical protein
MYAPASLGTTFPSQAAPLSCSKLALISRSVPAPGLPDGNEELRSRILGFMIKLLHLPQHVRSYFQHPCVQYAAGV